jgi:threonine synthase
LGFSEVLLAGLARDGGLYVPADWPFFTAAEIRAMRGLSYPEIAVEIMAPFVEGALSESELATIVGDAYANFTHPAVAPLKQLGHNQWVLELFHGPTLAFKDYALQLLGRLFDHVLAKNGQKVTIVGATSGDTGSAAIEACRDRDAIDIIILHPKGRVSDVQRRQMTSVRADNVRNIAIEGTFDDCQDLVKALFNDLAFRDELNLSAVNSINWARIMAQIVYYFASGVALGAPDVRMAYAVPTGNFGNIYAGYAARRMGLPIERLIIGSNRNDILTRTIETGTMKVEGVQPSLSPSMDIQISSNFERVLFHALGDDGGATAKIMEEFRTQGSVTLPQGSHTQLCEIFQARRFDDTETKQAIAMLRRTTGEVVDPHSAIGIAAGLACHEDRTRTLVALATAHPAKFPAAIAEAIGFSPPLPGPLADLMEREERYDVLPNDVDALKSYVRTASRVTA